MKCQKLMVTCAQCAKTYSKRADRIRSPDYCTQACRNAAFASNRKARAVACIICSTSFTPRLTQLRAGGGKFCSAKCMATVSAAYMHAPEARKKARDSWHRNGCAQKLRQTIGPKNRQWRGGRYESSGYVWLRKPGAGKIKGEHRKIMEDHLGRQLRSDEIVHHINHIKTDNRIENLAVMTRSEHMREHHPEISAARKLVGRRSV